MNRLDQTLIILGVLLVAAIAIDSFLNVSGMVTTLAHTTVLNAL